MYDFDSTLMIFYGLATGLVFGFLLQKGGVTRYQVILGQFLLKDFTVLKVMLTAIVTGAVGIWAMRAMGMDVPLHLKSATLAPAIVGGLIFGIGMALLGYCPGTGAAALGDGSRHVIPGLIGMVVGGGVFAEVFPLVKDNFMKMADVTVTLGDKTTDKITVADLTGLSPWWFVVAMIVIAAIVMVFVERIEKRSNRSSLESGG